MIHVYLEKDLLCLNDNEFHVKTARTVEEACESVKVGFEYLMEMNGAKIFRKRK